MPSDSYSELLELGLPSTKLEEKKNRLLVKARFAAAAGMMSTMQSQPADALVEAAPKV